MMQRILDSTTVELLKQLPSVNKLISSPALVEAASLRGRSLVLEACRTCLQGWRAQLRSGLDSEPPSFDSLVGDVLELLAKGEQSTIRRVINATGILLHTGLGRAPLPESAIDAVLHASGYCNVELDLSSGQRTHRHKLVEDDLCALTGAEAALVVNNNAGATGLVLATFATGRELVISHGQLIEIGGGFRLPDVFRSYGAILRAVGTTNRTRREDYESAVNERTGALMLVHTSNYQIVGFTQQVGIPELVEIASDRDFPVIHDVGSGALGDFFSAGEHREPLVADSVRQGADLVLFSGDKLLGGPQAGIIVGKRHCIEQLAVHPMSRALRVDKLTLAALQATLAIYRRGLSDPSAYDEIPFLQMLRTPSEELKQRAEDLANRLADGNVPWQLSAKESDSYVGGGSLPESKIDSWALVIQPTNAKTNVDDLAHQLRTATPSVVGRIYNGRLFIDLRSVDPMDDEVLKAVLAECMGQRLTGD